MVSALGIDPSLACLYDEMKVPHAVAEKFKREYGITSIEQLIGERLNLFEVVKKNISLDAARLLASVDYIILRRSLQDFASIDRLFSSAKVPKDSFEYFLARAVVTKGLCVKKLSKTPRVTELCKPKTGGKYWIVDEEENDWKKDVVANSDSELDEEKIRTDLLIPRDDATWTLDDSLQHVVLLKLPDAIKIPVPLFRKLYAHQREGIEWMADLYIGKTGGVLGDEMGMGKTMQSLVFLLCMMNSGTIRNALIVCPNPIVNTTWKKEARGLLRFFGVDCPIQVKIITTEMHERQRTKTLQVAKKCTTKQPYLIIVPYSQFRTRLPRGYKPLKLEFDYVVLDEAHKAKNKKSNTTINLRKVIGKESRIVMLTGTPLMNRLEELYRILELATGPKVLGKWEHFRSRFAKPIEAARQRDATDYVLQQGSKVIDELRDKIKPNVLMRKRNVCLKDIVPRNHEWDCWVALSPEQRGIYGNFLRSGDSNVQGIADGDHKCVLPVIGKLRKICGHPLLNSKERVLERCRDLGAVKVITMSPKLNLLADILLKSIEDGHRVLVFSHFLDMLDIMEFALSSLEGINACRIDGKTCSRNPRRLETIVNDFNSPTSMFNVMLISIKTGGEGLTLTGASKCIVYDPVWSQAESDQAVARICRPGQTRECESIYLIAAGTVEEKMFGKQVYKGLMGRTVLGESTDQGSISVSDSRLYNKDELSQLFELEPHGVCKTIERLILPSGGDAPTQKCIVSKNHPSIVGLTRRADIYQSKKRKADDDEDDDEAQAGDDGDVVLAEASSKKCKTQDEDTVEAAAGKEDEPQTKAPTATDKEDETQTEVFKQADSQTAGANNDDETQTKAFSTQDDIEAEAPKDIDAEAVVFSPETNEAKIDDDEVTQFVAI